MFEVRQEHFPLLLASIWGVQLHTHTCTYALFPHKEPEIGLLIELRQTELKGQQRTLYSGTCLVIVTANRKTIGDLNSQMITSTLSSVTVIQEKGRNTVLRHFFSILCFAVPR